MCACTCGLHIHISPTYGMAVNHSCPLIVFQCSELQVYLRPLLELLNGLKMGRFEKGIIRISVDD